MLHLATFSFALLLVAPVAAASHDRDRVPDEAEAELCGNTLLAGLVLDTVLYPWAGECVSQDDHEAPDSEDLEDTDDDGFADILERGLCHYEDRRTELDGSCVDEDYSDPNFMP